MSKKIKITLITIVCLFVLGIAGGTYYINNMLNKAQKIETTPEELGISEEVENELSKYEAYNDVINIALFGIDAGEEQVGRSDSIMILTIDPVKNKVKLASIMRDSYVNIPGRGNDKINHAFAFGNSTLALKTINQNFSLNIDKFVSTNFSNMPKIVDKLGGIELNIKQEELGSINSSIRSLNKLNNTNVETITSTGVQHVNGTQALAYARVRKTSGGDYERTSRHRIVMNALFKKFSSLKATEIPGVLSELLPFVQTNMSNSELLKIASTVLKTESNEIIEDRFPRDGYNEGKIINGVWYLTFDKETTKKQLHEFIYEE